MKIAVLTSGGVDSSVALRLLKDQGHDLTAFYLKIWLEDELAFLGNCPWEEDLNYVRRICKEISVPLKVMSLQKEYFETVVAYTIAEVKDGRTPNPDIMCNNHIKFGMFFDNIGKDFDLVATGHYAQVIKNEGKFFLKKSPDSVKDQTYFLSNLKQKQLKRIIFPIGAFTKEEVRKLAQKYKLPNKNRKDSQGICFLGKLKYADFIKHYLGEKPGDIIEFETGEKVGVHEGFWYYTIGQRRGIKLSGGPWYVVDKDVKKNVVYVSKKYHDKDKKRDTFIVEKLNWLAGETPKKKTLEVKLRHGEHSYKCKLKILSAKRVEIKLSERDQGIAPGQFAAFYEGDLCLGSAVISEPSAVGSSL